jgi:hypothetical protein
MAGLTWWMRIVGAFYILMALFNTPPVIEARFETQYPDIGVPVESAAAQALVDTWFMFGLEAGVIGLALLWCARNPMRHLGIAWLVIALEAVRGIADDLYLIARGYDTAIYAGWIVIHLVIIVTGVIAIRRAGREVKSSVNDGGVLEVRA